MEISYLGGDCIKLQTKQITALINPFDQAKTGRKLPKVTPDIVLFTVSGEDKPDLSSRLLINTPGEYEVKGLGIQAIPARLHIDGPEDLPRSVMYRLEYNNISLLFVGNIAPGLSDEQREIIGEIDALILPVGGHGLTLDAAAAAEIANQLEPRYIVPVHYDDGATKYEVPQDGVEPFLKEIGSEKPSAQPKLKLSDKTLAEETVVALLEATD